MLAALASEWRIPSGRVGDAINIVPMTELHPETAAEWFIDLLLATCSAVGDHAF